MYKLKDAVWHNKDTEDEWVEFGYGITADDMNIKLVKLGFNLKPHKGVRGIRGDAVESICGHFTSVENVLWRIYQLEIGLHSVEQLVKANNQIAATIDTCVANLGKLNHLRSKDLKGLKG